MGDINFLIVGYGRMGKLVEHCLKEDGEDIVGIVDPPKGMYWETALLDKADVAICFTSPDGGYEATNILLSQGIDAVVATTKFYLDDEGFENRGMISKFDTLAKHTNCKMIYSSNFAIGMHAFWEVLEPLAKLMEKLGYSVAIEERHHRRKADVSGTAKTIGGIVLDAYGCRATSLNFGDCERKVEPGEITLTSTRVGCVPGTHTVIFDSGVDTIEFIHRVRDPHIFARGAIDSARWLRKEVWHAGVYTLKDRLG